VKNSEKKSKTKKRGINWKKYGLTALFSLTVILPIVLFLAIFWGRVYYGVEFLGEDLSQKDYSEAKSIIDSRVITLASSQIDIYSDKIHTYPFSKLGLNIDTTRTTDLAMTAFRDKNIFKNVLEMIKAIKDPYEIEPVTDWNEEIFDKSVEEIEKGSGFVKAKSAVYAVYNGEIKILESTDGYLIDKNKLKGDILSSLSRPASIKISTTPTQPEFDTTKARESVIKAQEIAISGVVLKYDLVTYKIPGEELVSWLEIYKNTDGGWRIKLRDEQYKEFFTKISKATEREVKNPVLKIEGNKVTEFDPPRDGLKLDIEETMAKVLQSLNTEIKTDTIPSIDLVVKITKPENFENNQYGIRELLARGISDFSGSIAGRIHNIRLSTSRINGSLIAPGEEFSFNARLGDISRATGYQPAYIIENGRTVLGDGGGVCQVSTTAFRAAINAGLEITVRSPHAYRVGYYEKLGFKPGIDAAIYYPSLDLKFRNNTPKYILISAYINGTRLTFDFYGTDDNRQVKISEPIVTNIRPAPESKYQDDPTLARGVTKQVDFAAAGATTRFTQRVTLNGTTLIEKTFTSVYRPWQAIYLVGTKDN